MKLKYNLIFKTAYIPAHTIPFTHSSIMINFIYFFILVLIFLALFKFSINLSFLSEN